jgi:DivIVA domain-containing protein
MPLTPADVRNVTFSKPPIGKRGYHEGEVDALLDLVQAEMARLIEENKDLRNQVEQRDQQRRAAPVDTGNNLRPVEPAGQVMVPIRPPVGQQTSPDADHSAHAVKVLGLAQEMAERLTGEAKDEADRMLNKARATCERLLSEATTKAEGMVTEARARADTMITDARSRAETLERQSRKKAASLERDAARRHTEILGAINQEKSVLDKKIDELRTFEREYCARLKTYLQSQLRELGGQGLAAPAHPMRTQQDLVTAGSAARTETRS